MTMLDTTVLISVNRVDIMISQWTFASYISGSSFSYQWHLYPLYAQFLIDSWTHISYLHPWNGHFIPAGVNRSIPARMEQFILAGIKWAILFRPDWMVHFIPTGMDLFTPAGMEWAIPFLLEWNNPFYSGRSGFEHFVSDGFICSLLSSDILFECTVP